MHPEFTPLSGAAGLEIVDPIETRRFTLRTSTAVDPTPADPETFPSPVDSACRIRTDLRGEPSHDPATVPASSNFGNSSYAEGTRDTLRETTIQS